MGKAMLKPLKTKAEYLIDLLGDKLNENFENNKKVIKSLKLPFTKTVINKMSGYIVRRKKAMKKAN